MNAGDLNDYILNYINKSEVPGAIMITAPWGTGKSYYVTHSLIPFLEKEVPDEKCVSLSLYSVADVGSLCKGLFSSITLNRPKTQNKALIAGKLVAKTLYNGLSSHWGIDINYSEEASREVLSLLNLS